MFPRVIVVVILLSLLVKCDAAGKNRSAEATYQLVYQDIHTFLGCFRRFNGTHEIGCASDIDGNVGTLHYINSSESLKWLIETGPHHPYIPLITKEQFTGDNIKALRESDKVNGLMVIHSDIYSVDENPPQGFSPDLQCPNRESSIYQEGGEYSCDKHQFNPRGNGLMFVDFKFPVMVLKADYEVKKALDCYHRHNVPKSNDSLPEFPLCSVELKAFMHGAGNTKICMRRNGMIQNLAPDSFCDKLGGFSSQMFLGNTEANAKRNKTVVVVARTDTFSLFEYSETGASSPVSSIAVLMALTESLTANKDDILAAGYDVLILALTGEAFDYIGSQKVVYDMKQGLFPDDAKAARFNLDDVDIIVELSQLIDGLASRQLFVHTDPRTRDNHSSIKDFIQALQATVSSVSIKEVTNPSQPLPPSSSQMFLREQEQGVPAIVIADYDSEFKTKFYNSYLDSAAAHGFYTTSNRTDMYDHVTEHAEFLTQVASALATAIFSYTTKGDNSSIQANNATVTHVLYCFLVSPKCDLFYTVLSPENVEILGKAEAPFPLYVGVYNKNNPSNTQHMVLQILAYLSGQVIEMSEDACTHAPNTYWINGPLVNGTRKQRCIRSNVKYHNATSPAFEIEDYDYESHQYSTWSESVWPSNDPFHVRLFLRPSVEVQLACMVGGISLFIISAIVCVLIHKRRDMLFPPHVDAAGEPLTADPST